MLLTLTFQVSAFGIRPAQQSITFSPYLSYDGQFTVVRDTDTPGEGKAWVEGELEDYLSLDSTTLVFSGSELAIPYHLKLPATLPPGTHVGKIVVEEGPAGGATIGSRIRITFKVLVTNPYPDKYIQATLGVQATGETLAVSTNVQNLGQQDLARVTPSVTVTRSGGAVVKLDLAPQPIAVGNTATFTKSVSVPGLKPGIYSAKETVDYDGSTLELIQDFAVGSPSVQVTYADKFFKAGEISAFNLELQPLWDGPVRNVVAALSVISADREVASLRTERFDLADAPKRVSAYLDARQLPAGTYEALLTVTFDGGSVTERFPVELLQFQDYEKRAAEQPKAELSPAVIGLLALLVFNLIVITLIIAKLVRHRKESVAVFVRHARERGLSDAHIRERLAKAGWAKERIEQALRKR